MPLLPYAPDGLSPVISADTLSYHYGKHLQAYINNLNTLTAGTEYEQQTVEEIVASAPQAPSSTMPDKYSTTPCTSCSLPLPHNATAPKVRWPKPLTAISAVSKICSRK